MHVIRAKTAGFCMGVALALQKLDEAVENKEKVCKKDGSIFTLGPIIHNPQVLETYAEQGVMCLSSTDSIRAEDCIVVRAHGIPQQDEVELYEKHATIVDATCPKVKTAQMAIREATKDGHTLLLFGEENHPEVRGLVSYACHDFIVFDSIEKLKSLELMSAASYVLASQTTQDRRLFYYIEEYLREIYPEIPVLSTICDATRRRQDEIMKIAQKVDIVVVVGGKQSGNTSRLADVAQAQGVKAWHVETVDELKNKNFSLFASVGLTAGASTPKRLIDDVQFFLETLP